MSQEIEQVKKHLSSQSEQERLRALSETLNYGQQGLELLIAQSFHDKSERVKHLAYRIFRGDNPYVSANTPESLVTCPTDIITSLAISSDNTFIVGGSWQKIWIWYLQSGEIVRSFKGHSHWVLSVAISQDGNTLVSGSADATVKVWNLKTGQLIHTLSGHSSWITSVAISVDGKNIVSGSIDKTIKIWDLTTGNLRKTLKDEKELSSVLSLCISHDGKVIACGTTNNKITLWNLDSGQLIRSIEGHTDWIESLSITSDNSTLISGSRNGCVKVWQSKSEEKSSNESSSFWGIGLVDVAATVVGFSLGFPIAFGAWAVGRVMVSTGDNGNVSTLPFQNLECIKTYDNKLAINPLTCHLNQNIIVLGCKENIIIRELKDNKVIYSLPTQCGFINSVAVSPNGKIIVIAGNDWVILLNSQTGKPLHALKGCSYPKLSKIVISQPPQELLCYQSKQFSVKGLDQNSKNISLNFQDIKWEATGGKIEQGLFTAGKREGKFEVKAKIGIFEASVAVTIIDPPRITNFFITPSSLTLKLGEVQYFTAKILDQRRNFMQENVLWEVKEGGTIDQNGKFIAGSKPGNFEIIASVGSIRRVIPVIIVEPPKLTELIIISSPSQLEFRESFQFQVKGLDQYGNNIQTGEITWSTSSGKINIEGKFCAGEREESVTIKASAQYIYAYTQIKVCEPSRLTKITIIPSSITLEPGDVLNFSVVAFNQRGKEITVRDIEWNATDGLIDEQTGYFYSREDQKGYCQVSAKVGNFSAKAEVLVPPVLRELKIFPKQVELKPEEEFTFTVSGFDQAGDPLERKNVEWATTAGGAITYEGTFKGNYKKREVTVTATVENIRDTSKVILLPVLRRLEIEPGFVYLKAYEKQTFMVKSFDQFGSKIEPGDVYWETSGGKINQNGTLTFERDEQGYFEVTVTSQLAPKHSQNIKTLLLYTGISSKIISYFISHTTSLQNLWNLVLLSTDTPKQLDASKTQETNLDTEAKTNRTTNNIVKYEDQLCIEEVEKSAENDIFVDTNLLNFSTGLEELFLEKLQKLITRALLSVSRFCLSEANANLSAYAEVFVLAGQYNPYKYFECLKVLSSHSQIVTALTITPDGQKLISGGWDNTIKFWNLSTGGLLNTLRAHTEGVDCLAIAPNGQMLVSSGWDKTIKIWDLNTSQLVRYLDCSANVSALALALDGQTLISGEMFNLIKVWNLNNQEISNKLISVFKNYVKPLWWHKSVALTPDAKQVIFAIDFIIIYDLKTGELVHNLSEKELVYSLAITPDGGKLISGHKKKIKIWDLETKYPKILLTLESYVEGVSSLAVMPDSRTFVSCGLLLNKKVEEKSKYRSLIEIWDINTGEKIHCIEENFNSEVCCLAITPNGKKIVAGYGDGTIKIWGIPELN